MVMQDDNLKLQPISMALYILELTRGDLDSSKEQLKNMQEIKHKPYILDDEMINRSIRYMRHRMRITLLFCSNVLFGKRKN